MTLRCPGPVATKQAPNHQPSTSMCDFWYEVFVLKCSLVFHQTWHIMAKHLHFGLICSKDIVLEILWFVQMQLCKPKLCCHAFLEKRLSSGKPSKHAILVPYFSNCTILSFNMLTEACKVCGVVLGLSAILGIVSVTWSDLGVNLLGCPFLGGLVSVLNVFHLWINFHTVEWWISHCLEMVVLLFPDWWQQQLLL